MLRIWFNEQYRGTYQLIGLLRRSRPLWVHGSHSVATTPFLQACDRAFPEPAQTGDAFVDVALEHCAAHGIEVFVPGREMLAVARRLEEFEAAGVRVMVSPARAIEVLADKRTTYAAAAALGVAVPRTRVVSDAAGFAAACDELAADGTQVCVKPARDHGAHGFRLLLEQESYADLLAPPAHAVPRARYEELLAEAEPVEPLVVSEYLPGAETSIDCLSDGERLLSAVCRGKSGPPWTRLLSADPVLVALARQVVEGFGLRYLSNVQVRCRADGTPVLLEVNTRAASGLYQSCASGVDLAGLALELLLTGRVGHVPAPVAAPLIAYTDALPFVPLVAPDGVEGFPAAALP